MDGRKDGQTDRQIRERETQSIFVLIGYRHIWHFHVQIIVVIKLFLLSEKITQHSLLQCFITRIYVSNYGPSMNKICLKNAGFLLLIHNKKFRECV